MHNIFIHILLYYRYILAIYNGNYKKITFDFTFLPLFFFFKKKAMPVKCQIKVILK